MKRTISVSLGTLALLGAVTFGAFAEFGKCRRAPPQKPGRQLAAPSTSPSSPALREARTKVSIARQAKLVSAVTASESMVSRELVVEA